MNNNRKEYSSIYIVALVLSGFILGFYGYYHLPNYNFLDSIYSAVRLFSLNFDVMHGSYPLMLEIARWIAFIVVFYTLFKIISSLFFDQISKLKLLFYKEHCVVCGLNEYSFHLSKELLTNGEKVVVIEGDLNNEFLEPLKSLRKRVLLIGQLSEKNILKKAKVEKAKYIIIFSGIDRVNIETYLQIGDIIRDDQHCPEIKIQLEEKVLSPIIENMTQGNDMKITIFNIHENAVKQMFNRHPIHEGFNKDFNRIHIIIVGFNSVAEQVAINALVIGNYGINEKVKISIYGDSERARIFRRKYRNIEQICDFESKPYPKVYDDLNDVFPTYISICKDNEQDAFVSAFLIARRLNRRNMYNVPILVNVEGNHKFSNWVDCDTKQFSNIFVYGGAWDIANVNVVINEELEEIAQSIHNLYIEAEKEKGKEVMKWHDLPLFKKESNRDTASHIDTKLYILGLTRVKNKSIEKKKLKEINRTVFNGSIEDRRILEQAARAEHDRWCVFYLINDWDLCEKTSLGYCQFNEEKKCDQTHCEDIKKHTLLINWDTLMDEDKQKNENIIKGLPELLAELNYILEKRD